MLRTLVLLMALCSISFMAFNTTIAPIGRLIGMADWQVGATMSVSGLSWMLAARPWGRLADAAGRIAVMRRGLFGMSIAFFLIALIAAAGIAGLLSAGAAFFGLVVARGVLGGSYAAMPVSSQAMVADELPPEQRTAGMASLGASTAIGMIFGPALGALLGRYDLMWPLWLAVVLSLFAFFKAIKAVGLPSRAGTGQAQGNQASAPLSIRDSRTRWPIGVAFATMFMVMSLQVITAFFIIDRHAYQPGPAVSATGALLVAIGLGTVAAQMIVRRIDARSGFWTPMRLIAWGASCSAIACVAASLSPSVLWMAVAYLVAGVGSGLLFPSFAALTSLAVGPHEQGAAAGSMAAAQAAGMVLGPAAATGLYHIAPEVPYWFAAALMLLLSLLAFGTLTRVPAVTLDIN